ncbi:hypothetical protein DIPPA_27730 [Diplonema papillatum]|nr:hypothetical protein DIPPA_27730 [Diplonema papillatum]
MYLSDALVGTKTSPKHADIPETDGESSAPTPDTTPREGKTQRALRFLGFGSRSGDSEVALTATNSAASLSSVGSARSSPSVEPKSSPRRFGEQRKRPILQKSVGAAAADAPTTPRAPPPAPVATDESGQSPGALHLSPSGRRRRSRCGSPSAQLPKETILERVRHIYIEKEGKSARNVELIMKEYEDNVHDLYDMLCRRHELSFDD